MKTLIMYHVHAYAATRINIDISYCMNHMKGGFVAKQTAYKTISQCAATTVMIIIVIIPIENVYHQPR